MKNLYKSLASFQQEVPVIHKGTTGFNYSYADLPAIFEVINPLLGKHGLGFYQAVNGTQIKTVIFHIDSGETIESNTDIPQGVQLNKMNDFQVLGSAITYIKRYALSSLLGLVTDKDTDASGEQVKKSPVAFINRGLTAPPILPDEAFLKAQTAMKDAKTLIELNKVSELVSKSKLITPEKKEELGFLYTELTDNFDPTAI